MYICIYIYILYMYILCMRLSKRDSMHHTFYIKCFQDGLAMRCWCNQLMQIVPYCWIVKQKATYPKPKACYRFCFQIAPSVTSLHEPRLRATACNCDMSLNNERYRNTRPLSQGQHSDKNQMCTSIRSYECKTYGQWSRYTCTDI